MSSFLNKVGLLRQLQSLGITVEGNYVRKSDITKVISNNKDIALKNALDEVEEFKKKVEFLEKEGKALAKKYKNLKGSFQSIDNEGELINKEDNFGSAFANSVGLDALRDAIHYFILNIRQD